MGTQWKDQEFNDLESSMLKSVNFFMTYTVSNTPMTFILLKRLNNKQMVTCTNVGFLIVYGVYI